MTITREYYLHCDQCHDDFTGGDRIGIHFAPREILAKAKREGWVRRVSGKLGKKVTDLCKFCAEKKPLPVADKSAY